VTTLSGKTALVNRRLARHRPCQRACPRQGPEPRCSFHYGRGAVEAEGVIEEIRKPAVAPMRSPPISPPRTARTSSPSRPAASSGDRLDILVANAGVSKAATIEDTTVEDFDRLFAVNVRAPFFLVPAIAADPGQRQQHRPRLVARRACLRRARSPAYGATKGAVDTLVKALRLRRWARATSASMRLAPGVVRNRHVKLRQDGRRTRLHALASRRFKRLAQPADIGGVDRFPGLRRCALDHGRHHPGRWRLEAIEAAQPAAPRPP